jgi:hypothetical protein
VSGVPNATAALPRTCARFHCFTRADLGEALDAPGPPPSYTPATGGMGTLPADAGDGDMDILPDAASQAFLDFCLAARAAAFYGNMYSTFSEELAAVFRAQGKAAAFLNPACPASRACGA